MAENGFYNVADFISYPLVAGGDRAFLPAGPDLPRRGIAGGWFMLGVSSGFTVATHAVTLHSVEVTASKVRFDFRADSPGFAGYRWWFEFDVADLFGTMKDATAETIIGAAPDEDVGWAELVMGDLAELIALGIGVHALRTPVPVEPALIQSLADSYVKQIDLANDGRSCPVECSDSSSSSSSPPSSSSSPPSSSSSPPSSSSSPPSSSSSPPSSSSSPPSSSSSPPSSSSSPPSSSSSPPSSSSSEEPKELERTKVPPSSPPAYVQARGLVGDVKVKEGYNIQLLVSVANNALRIKAVKGAGAGETCVDYLIGPGGFVIDPGDACRSCTEFIRRINGMATRDGRLTISGGPGVDIFPDPVIPHRLVVRPRIERASCSANP